MTLFAITNQSAARILRFPLAKSLQDEISAVFAEQFASFYDGIHTIIPFDGRYRPGEGELLSISGYADTLGLYDAVENPLSIDQFDPQLHGFESIKALFSSIDRCGKKVVLIQLFENRRLISNKGFTLLFSDNTFRRMSDSGLTLDTRLLATFQDGELTFQSFHFLNRVLDLGGYFKEATLEEVTEFARHQKLSVDNLQAFITNAGLFVRKKITLIMQSGVLDNFTTEQIVSVAKDFNFVVATTDDGRIVLPSSGVELTKLLRLLDEDYFESPLTQTHFVSNSKRVAD